MRRIIVALIITFLFGSCRNNDKSSLIIGIWVYEKSFIYFTDNNKFLTGIFESGYTAGGNWSIIDNNIHFNGREVSELGEGPFYNSIVLLEIIDHNTVKINETIFRRISEQALLDYNTSKARLNELMLDF